MSGLRLTLILNPKDDEDRSAGATVPKGDRVFMRILVTNDSNGPVAFDHLSAEIFANYNVDILALAPTDCPHAGDLADEADLSSCAVSNRTAKSGGLRSAGNPANGTELDLTQTLMPGQQVGGYRLGTGKAGLVAKNRPFVLNPGVTVQVADGRSRTTGMIGDGLGSTPVIALGFASIKGAPLVVTPAHAVATVVATATDADPG